jgi:COP9 signalosome complex subunit 3
MAAELLNILLNFQSTAPELQQRREYDKEARDFISNLSNITPSHYLKGADTAQDALSVSEHEILGSSIH